MMDDEEDAVAERSFHARLIQIDADMHREDLNALKFLCKDKIAKSKLAGTKCALDVFGVLEITRLVSAKDPWLLVEIFNTIGRLDLVDHLDIDETRLKTFKTSGKISKYRQCLFDVAQEMTVEDTKKLCFLCEKIPRGRREKVLSALDLFSLLEESKLLSATHLNSLLQHLAALGRLDLVNKIQALKKDYGGSTAWQEGTPQGQLESAEHSQTTGASLHREIPKATVDSQKVTPLHKESPNGGVHSQNDELHKLPQEYMQEVEEYDRCSQDTNLQVSAEEAAVCQGRGGREVEFEAGWRGDMAESILPFYKMDAKPREKLQKTFEGLQFDVRVVTDSTVHEMKSLLTEIAQGQTLPQHDCFVCCVLTHGKNQQIYGSHGHTIPIRDLMALFRTTTCPNLAGKPKLFFLQACQGSQTQEGMEVEEDGLGQEVVPDEADFLLGYATAPGYVSYRSKREGTWYIGVLTSLLDKHAHQLDLLSILTLVNNDVCKKGGIKIKQSPAPQYTLRRKLLFKKLHNH